MDKKIMYIVRRNIRRIRRNISRNTIHQFLTKDLCGISVYETLAFIRAFSKYSYNYSDWETDFHQSRLTAIFDKEKVVYNVNIEKYKAEILQPSYNCFLVLMLISIKYPLFQQVLLSIRSHTCKYAVFIKKFLLYKYLEN